MRDSGRDRAPNRVDLCLGMGPVAALLSPAMTAHAPREWPAGLYLIRGFMSVPHVLVDADGAVLLDTGFPWDVPRIRRTFERLGLGPRDLKAILLTHGHIDHMFSVLPVADGYDIPAWVHPADRDRIGDPFATMSPEANAMVRQLGVEFAEPSDVRELTDGVRLQLAGFDVTVRHAPGHTEGSVMFETDHDGTRTLFSGDVLFSGSVGRTDLPGGDPAAMDRTLRTVVLPMADDVVVHCGHGPSTTIGQERRSNPFLRAISA